MKDEAFLAAYKGILSAVNKHDISRGHNREVSAYLCYLTFAILDYDAPQYIPVSPNDFMYQRMRLYANLSSSDLLNNWLCPDIPDLSENPLFHAFIAFGDLLINGSARKDYHSAPLVIHEFAETVSFCISMLQAVLPLTNEYIDQLISEKELIDSVSDASTSCNLDMSEEAKKIYSEARARDDLAKYKKEQESKSRRKNNLIIVLCILLTVSVFAVIWLLPSNTFRPDSLRSPTFSPRVTVRTTFTPAPTSAPTPRPTVATRNGMIFVSPEYVSTCPFSVTADSDSDYFIYLEYQRAPDFSHESRKQNAFARFPYESDIAFIVKAGNTVSVDVPIGVYKLYYATGTDFYGVKDLFGDDTEFYASDNLLSFYFVGGFYNGHTITLYPVSNGNFDTEKIPESSFPTK